MCPSCEPDLRELATAALSVARWHEANDPTPLGEAIDSVLSLLPARVERRRWAVRALAAIRRLGIRPVVAEGALRVPMELLPAPLRQWLDDPVNREAVEDLLDEEGGLRLYGVA